MSELPELTPEMRAAIGQENPPTTFEVTTLGIRTFARAVGYTNPVHFDRDAATAAGYPDLLAPLGYFGHPIFDPNSTVNEPSDPGAREFPRGLNGGTAVEPIEPVYAGDILEASVRIASLEIRQGRLGTMLVRVLETTYTRTSDGVVVGRVRGTRIRY